LQVGKRDGYGTCLRADTHRQASGQVYLPTEIQKVLEGRGTNKDTVAVIVMFIDIKAHLIIKATTQQMIPTLRFRVIYERN